MKISNQSAKGARASITARKRKRIHAYRDMGLSYRDIAKLVGCSHTSVAYEIDHKYKLRHREYTRQWVLQNDQSRSVLIGE